MNSVKMFQENEQRLAARRETTTISGNRPSPLKINRDSHLIHKHQPSRMAGVHHQPQQKRQHPVIIYTQSPKVIHTRPHNFMALVQKLTGISRSDEDQSHNESAAHKTLHTRQAGDRKDESAVVDRFVNDNETSSGMTDEISGGDNREEENVNVGGDVLGDSSCYKPSPNRFSGFSPMQQQNQHPYFSDIPMFTPTSMDQNNFLCSSPRPLYRFSDSSSLVSPSTLCGSISPSMFKFIKGLPEY